MDFKQVVENYDIYKRNKITYHVLFTLKAPLSHIGSVVGNVANLNTIGSLDPEGNACDPFIYSGNALRGKILRRIGIKSALENKLGIRIDPNTHATMFSGGRIDGPTANDMDLDTKIRKLMPWLSVVGTAKPSKVFGSSTAQMIDGRIKVGNAYLICYESARKIHPRFLSIRATKAIKTIVEAERSFADKRFPTPHKDAYIDGSYQEQQVIERAFESLETLKVEQNEILRDELKSWYEFITTQQKVRQDSLKDTNLVNSLFDVNRQLKENNITQPPAKSESEPPKAAFSEPDSFFAQSESSINKITNSVEYDLFGNVIEKEEKKKEEKKDTAKKEKVSPPRKEKESEKEPEKRKSDQMIMRDRLIRDGVQMVSRWDFEGTEIEEGYIYDAINEFSKTPYLGGKGNTGNGLVDIEIFFNDHRTKEGGRLFSAKNQLIETTERFEINHKRYNEYLEQYAGYLAESSSEIKGFLGV
jgi:hypothetical protein